MVGAAASDSQLVCPKVDVAVLKSDPFPGALIGPPSGSKLPKGVFRVYCRCRYFLAYCGALAVQGPPISGNPRLALTTGAAAHLSAFLCVKVGCRLIGIIMGTLTPRTVRDHTSDQPCTPCSLQQAAPDGILR